MRKLQKLNMRHLQIIHWDATVLKRTLASCYHRQEPHQHVLHQLTWHAQQFLSSCLYQSTDASPTDDEDSSLVLSLESHIRPMTKS